MRRAKGIADEQAIAERGELPRKGFVVLFFLGVKAHVFEHQDAAVTERLALRFGLCPDTIGRETHRLTEELFELFRGGTQRILRVRTSFGPAAVRSQNEPPALLDREAERGQRLADARVVGHSTVLEGHVEVHTDEHALAAKLQIVDG